MAKRTRLLILLACVICFFTATPFLVAYSMGYRFDFEARKIVGTGGIYVRTFPVAEQITIDSKITAKPGIFSNAVFVQSLLPDDHAVNIKKNGYYEYFKTLPVQEKTVTKLENVTLFKKSLAFSPIENKIDYFFISPDGQNFITAAVGKKSIEFSYYNPGKAGEPQTASISSTGEISEIKWSDNSSAALIRLRILSDAFYYLFDTAGQIPTITRLPYLDKNSKQIYFNPINTNEIFYEENYTLYSLKNNLPKTVIKNLTTYTIFRNNILWMSADGDLFESDTSGVTISVISNNALAVNKNAEYKITDVSGKIFLQENNSIFLFNPAVKKFEDFEAPAGAYKILSSPDDKNIILWNGEEIHVYSYSDKSYGRLYSGSGITNAQWLNDDYIIFTAGDEVIISEIDYRGNTNAITLPGALHIGDDKTIEVDNPKIFFARQNGNFYIFTKNSLFVSEKITP